MVLRRTKIVATVGPASDRSDELDRMIIQGMDVARVNVSHGSREDHERRIRLLRERGEAHERHIGVLLDLQGPKIRIEGFRDGEVQLEEGASFVLDPALGPRDGTVERVGVAYRNLARDLSPGDVLLLDDGNVVIRVTQLVDERVHSRVVTGGVLSDHKGLNRQGGGLSADALTDKDLHDIRLAAQLQADYLAISFVRDADDVIRARELLREAGGNGGIVAKIERAEAVANAESIIEAADAVMIARGDLGVEIGDAELPGMQKRLIRQAREMNRVVITATQMMQSMVDSPQPTRAEVLDVANAVMDGTDAVMLSAETAVGRHPAKVIAAMDRICRGAERQRATMESTHRMDVRFEAVEESIAMAAMYTANHFKVAAIVAMTESGATPHWMSRISSGIPIFAMSPHVATVRRVSLYRGVYPLKFDADEMSSAKSDQYAIEELRRRELIKSEDRIIITKGDLTGVAGGTNTMKIVKV